MKEQYSRLYSEKLKTAEEAVQCVKSGDRVYVGNLNSTAYVLADALFEREQELENVTILSTNSRHRFSFLDHPGQKAFRISTYYFGPVEREAAEQGIADFAPLNLSQIDRWCKVTGRPDVNFFEVSPPDEEGWFSFGCTGNTNHIYLMDCAKINIVQVNKHVPYTMGVNNRIHISQVDAVVEGGEPLDTLPNLPFDETMKSISEYILPHIKDGSCIQLGIGGVANAVGFGLTEKNDLGVHSEMMNDAIMFLMKNGNVTNAKKQFIPNKTVASFCFGTQELYDFIDHNSDLCFMPFPEVNRSDIIAKNDNVISINTAMPVDLYGQVASDSIGFRQVSAIGGQVDFVRGAQMSKGGKSFICMTSRQKGKSRIMTTLPRGTAVGTSRTDVQYVVTEYGCVDLSVLTLKERAAAMIEIAHPEDRERLREEAGELKLL